MVRVTVELLPLGSEDLARHLGTATITNDGSGTLDVGNYEVMLSKWDDPNAVWKKGRVEDFRRRSMGPWDLLYLALKDTVGDRNERPTSKE